MKKILIIGGEGYIGNIIAQNLLQDGRSVISLDNLIYGNQYCVLNKTHFFNYKFVNGDMLQTNILEPLIQQCDTVILLAGLVGDPITKSYPKESSLINDSGVKNVIDCCAKNNTNKFIFVSTCSNYGLLKNDEYADENYALNPLSLYSKSKVNAEKYILSYLDKTDMNPTILRFATAFGLSPRMRFDLTISEFTLDLAMGKNLLVYDSHTWRPYCHVRDFALLIRMVIDAPKEKVSWEVFNAGCDANNATKQKIVDTILEKIPDGKVSYQDHGTDPRNYRVNFEKVRSVLGFEPEYNIENGVDELLELINNHVFDYINQNKNYFGNYKIIYPVTNE